MGVRPSKLLPHGAEAAWRFCTALGLVLVPGWSEVGLLNASQAHEPQHLPCLLEEPILFAGGRCPYDFPPQATPDLGGSSFYTLRMDLRWFMVTPQAHKVDDRPTRACL